MSQLHASSHVSSDKMVYVMNATWGSDCVAVVDKYGPLGSSPLVSSVLPDSAGWLFCNVTGMMSDYLFLVLETHTSQTINIHSFFCTISKPFFFAFDFVALHHWIAMHSFFGTWTMDEKLRYQMMLKIRQRDSKRGLKHIHRNRIHVSYTP